MALVAATAAHNREDVFSDDDEETWKILVDLSDSDPDITSRLHGLAKRLQEDWCAGAINSDYTWGNGEQYWKDLVGDFAHRTAFIYSDEASERLDSHHGQAPAASGDIPAAFQTDAGKNHIMATSALLGLSESRAVQVTLGAFRSMDVALLSTDGETASKMSDLSSILGTHDLLQRCMMYHYNQRLARLSVLAECMRLEETPQTLQRDVIVGFLNSLDSTFSQTVIKDSQRMTIDRGLFKSLVIVGCQPDPKPNLSSLEPSKQLLEKADGAFESFAASVIEENIKQAARERTQAMEGILALLYGDRMQGGMMRCDYGLLVSAAFASDLTTKRTKEDSRWKNLVGLVCAESMSLWKTIEVATDGTGMLSNSSAPAHNVSRLPSMLSDLDSPLGMAEMESLINMWEESVRARVSQNTWLHEVERPESVAVFSFGLLLMLTRYCLPNTSVALVSHKPLCTHGMDFVRMASDYGGVFDYLALSLSQLFGPTLTANRLSVECERLFDWQLSRRTGGDSTEAITISRDETDSEYFLSAENISYSSIAQEVVGVTISLHRNSLLSVDEADSPQKIGFMCSLFASIAGNNAVLCDQFWDSWDAYLPTKGIESDTQRVPKFPFCQLFDSSYDLALLALKSVTSSDITAESFVKSVAPFIQLFVTLCYTSDLVEKCLEDSICALLQTALMCCTHPNHAIVTLSEDTTQCKLTILQSFAKLSQVGGKSRVCSTLLRSVLEEEANSAVPNDEARNPIGPVFLARIVSDNHGNDQMTCAVLTAIGHLLTSAPASWAVAAASQFLGEEDAHTSNLKVWVISDDEEIVYSAVLVLAGLVRHFDALTFATLLEPKDCIAYVKASGSCLEASLRAISTTINERPKKVGDFATKGKYRKTIGAVLQSIADFLKCIRPLLREETDISNGVILARDSLIQTLASQDICGGIVYYATAPVSQTIVLKMEDEMKDAHIFDQIANEDRSKGGKEGAAWAQLLSSKSEADTTERLVTAKLRKFISEMSANEIDFEAIQAREESNFEFSLSLSWAAIRVLSEWASHVEEIARTHQQSTPLEDSTFSTEASNVVREYSPQRCLFSFAPMPPSCRSDGRLSALWQELRLSVFDLLLVYLSVGDLPEDVPNSSWIPTSLFLDLLNVCMLLTSNLNTTAMLEELPLVRALSGSHRLVPNLMVLLKQGLQITAENEDLCVLSDEEREVIRSAFLSLRILRSFSVLNGVVPIEAFNDSLLDLLVTTASSKPPSILQVGEHGNTFSTESSVLQMRFASASMEVLSSIFESTESIVTNSAKDLSPVVSKYCTPQCMFVTTLIKIISDFTNLDDVAASSSDNAGSLDRGKISIFLFVKSALSFIKTAFVSDEQPGANRTIESYLLKDEICPRIFYFLPSFSRYLQSQTFFGSAIRKAGLSQNPAEVMFSFPSTASSLLAKDYYSIENHLDEQSLCRWFAAMRAECLEERTVTLEMVVDELSRLHGLLIGELCVLESWVCLLEIAAHESYYRHDYTLTPSIAESLMLNAECALESLRKNLHIASEIVRKGTTATTVIVRMSKSLCQLLQFLLELGALNSMSLNGLSRCLSLATDAMESLHIVFRSSQQTGSIFGDTTYYDLQQHLLTSCLIVVGLLGEKSKSDQDHLLQRDENTKLCSIICVFLQYLSRHADKRNTTSDRDINAVRMCASLLIHIVLSASQADSLRNIAGILKEYEVPKVLMLYASRYCDVLSKDIADSGRISEGVSSDGPALPAVVAVFKLLEVLSASCDWDILSTIPILELSHLVVRNPIFEARLLMWCGENSVKSPPRGYIFKGDVATVTSQKVSLLVGTDDPIFHIWLIAMRILSSVVRTCARSADPKFQASSHRLAELPIEFLRLHREPLLASLRSCEDKLTTNALKEVTVLLQLLASLLCRDRADTFERSYNEFDEFLDSAKIIVSALSKYLGAIGNSQELFIAVHEHEKTEEVDPASSSSFAFARERLLSQGLSNVKHEAIKFSHYASARSVKITQSDFEASGVVPHHLKPFSVEHGHENDLERNCRLAVTSKFSLRLTRITSECLAQALSILWKMHPSKLSYYAISGNCRFGLDLSRLLTPGLVVGYRQMAGTFILDESTTFLSLKFGTVLETNTFERTAQVGVIQEEGSQAATPGTTDCIRLEQIVGVEDKSARNPSADLMAAPCDMASFEILPASLSTANYIMILRWCHQQHVFGQSQALANVCKQIAEEAAILLAADLIFHQLNGNLDGSSKEMKSRLNEQMFELFADKEMVESNVENQPSSLSFNEGRLKNIISSDVWVSLQQQVRPFIQQAWSERIEAERLHEELKGSKRRRSGYRFR